MHIERKCSGDLIFGLVGVRGCAREVTGFAIDCITLSLRVNASHRVCFVGGDSEQREINGIPNFSEDEFFSIPVERRLFNVAIADS